MSAEVEILEPRALNVGGRPSKYDPRYCEDVIAHCVDGREVSMSGVLARARGAAL